jgi:patatin-related protein
VAAGATSLPPRAAGEAPELAPPPFRGVREVRLAVVMYGGVSLAIYMNGVAQELLHLVRSTAPAGTPARGPAPEPNAATADPDEYGLPLSELRSTEPVYRRLGQMRPNEPAPAAAPAPSDPVITRFTIDILSGTSAGGINAVFLAKALANDQSLDGLSTLWIEEGDIAKLLNDRASARGEAGVAWQRPPRSLLNGQRMYRKLLTAFHQMDASDPLGTSDSSRESALAQELDLYVTATDLTGLRQPIRLSNRVIDERRFRTVFHFAYATEEATGEHRNDFHADHNPFLAFVSRCTSAFPFAFEPMVLTDIDPVVDAFPPYSRQTHGAASPRWAGFFADYASPRPGVLPYADRAFGDGGALDNKPFSYATSTLLRRHTDLPIDRKLLFIEPDPAGEDLSLDPSERPDVVANALKQGHSLPRQETIREDIQRIADRNRTIARIDRLLLGVEQSRLVAPAQPGDAIRAAVALRGTGRGTGSRADTELRAWAGSPSSSYHRLRVQAVTDDLAALFARVAGFDEDSDDQQAIRSVVSVWRRRTFSDPARAAPGAPTTLDLLDRFDLGFDLRRLLSVRRQLDRLFLLDADASTLFRSVTDLMDWPREPATAVFDRDAFRDEVLVFMRLAGATYRPLRNAGRALRSRSEANPLRGKVLASGITAAALAEASGASLAVRDRLADETFEANRSSIEELACEVGDRVETARASAEAAWRAARESRLPPTEVARNAVRQFVDSAYAGFESYDMIAFPLAYGTDVGESDEVEVIRVSPRDTARAREHPGAPPVVTGGRYMHFGAFLDRLWRENDILWGRMDGADILIESLVQAGGDGEGSADRQETVRRLREQAHRSIIDDQLRAKDRGELVRLLAEVLSRTSSGDQNEAALRDVLAQLPPLDDRIVSVLRALLSAEDLRAFYQDRYRVGTQLPAPQALRSVGRAAHIAGDLLRGTAASRSLGPAGAAFGWVARLGRLFSGLVEVATPGSVAHHVAAHWMVLLYVFEGLAVVVGFSFGSPAVQRLGLLTLFLTTIAVVAVDAMGRLLAGGAWFGAPLKILLALAVLAFTVVLVAGVRHVGEDLSSLWHAVAGCCVAVTEP